MGRHKDDSSEEKTPVSSLQGFVNLGTGWRRPADEFGLYAEAFHKAAQQLTEVLSHDPAYDPLDACPIVFLYRHSTELYLKGVLRAGESLLRLSGEKPTFDASNLMSHPLRPLLGPLEELFAAMGWSESYKEVASFIEPLDKLDSNSFAFRYPVDKKNVGTLPESFVFNVLSFARAADSCLEMLYNALHSIDAHTEETIDNLHDFGEEP